MRFDRRAFVGSAAATAAAACVPIDRSGNGRLEARLRIIEAGLGGTLGVRFLDPAQSLTLGYNDTTRFALCSTFKTSLAALVLAKGAAGELDLQEQITWSEDDLLSYAPFAKEKLAEGATLLDLAEATQVISDNTAANLLLEKTGGPEQVTAFWRSVGDKTSRLDRDEPQVNFVPDGELRDTTTPSAMARTLNTILFGDVLSAEHATLLRQWMVDTRTGLRRVRAGLPENWEKGDKTGTSGDWPGMGYTRGDIGYVRAPTGDPVIFAVWHRAPLNNSIPARVADRGIAEVGNVLTDWIRRNYTIQLTG